MEDLIVRFNDCLRVNRPEFYASLNDGAKREDISELEKAIGAPIPELYKKLLMWKNGQADDSSLALQGMYLYMSCSNIISTIEMMRDLRENDESFDDATWNTLWLPFLDNGSGDNICIDLNGSFGGKPGQIIEYIHDDYRRAILYPSFEAWLTTFVEALEAELYKEDEYLFVPRSDKTYAEFMTKHNFGYPIAAPTQE